MSRLNWVNLPLAEDILFDNNYTEDKINNYIGEMKKDSNFRYMKDEHILLYIDDFGDNTDSLVEKYKEVESAFTNFKYLECDDMNNEISGYSGYECEIEYYIYLYSKKMKTPVSAFLINYFKNRDEKEDEYNFVDRLYNAEELNKELNKITREYKDQINDFIKNQKIYNKVVKLLYSNTNFEKDYDFCTDGSFTLGSIGEFELSKNEDKTHSIEFGYWENKWYFIIDKFVGDYNLLNSDDIKIAELLNKANNESLIAA